jgi:hypothetical protein
MVRSLTFGGVLALACCTALPALAQDIVTERAIRQGQISTVQSSFNSTLSLDENSDVAAMQIEALRNFYKMAEGSCAEVLATVASSCEIFRLTTNVGVTEAGQRGRRLTVNGQITMKVEFKAPDSKPAE